MRRRRSCFSAKLTRSNKSSQSRPLVGASDPDISVLRLWKYRRRFFRNPEPSDLLTLPTALSSLYRDRADYRQTRPPVRRDSHLGLQMGSSLRSIRETIEDLRKVLHKFEHSPEVEHDEFALVELKRIILDRIAVLQAEQAVDEKAAPATISSKVD